MEECTIPNSHKINVTSSEVRRYIFKISSSLVRMGIFRTCVIFLAFQFDSERNVVSSSEKEVQSNELPRVFHLKNIHMSLDTFN